MPYTNEWNTKGLRRTFNGPITGTEVIVSNFNIQNDERFNKIDYVLNDFTEIESFNISDFHISQISAMDHFSEPANNRLKIIIVTTDENFLKFVNMYLTQMQDSSFDCVVFNDMESALKSIN
ncbi:MAG: hypothetical protein OEY78_10435 [Gammaproteobacteria bacterium]|nr:hypothetical protein [Gammaproteobacteria bacterium]